MDIIVKSSNAVRKATKYLKSEISNWIRKHNEKKEVFLENFSVWFDDVFLSQFEINPYETTEYGEFIYN